MKKLSPADITLPDQAPQWTKYCQEIVGKTPVEYQEICDGYGISWYETGKVWKPEKGHSPKKILWMSPHSDDLELAGAVTMRHHVQKGDDVSELLFTCGSAGMDKRGFADDETFVDVRLAEAIMGAQEVGIHRVGVIRLPDESFGFEEWFWDGDAKELRPVWIAIARKLNPHYIFSPHPDDQIDSHPDHHAVGLAAEWATGWGTETDFYAGQIPSEEPMNFEKWYRYATWTRSKTLPVNYRMEFDPDGELARLKKRALLYFVSQDGESYAKIAQGYNIYHGAMANVGNAVRGEILMAAEVFNVFMPPVVVKATYDHKDT